MSKQHGARDQKRLAKQKAKKDAKRRQLAQRNSPDPNIRLKSADSWPILCCLVPENLWEYGMGTLLIGRRMGHGQVACGLFLLDTFCMGVKNAMWSIRTSVQFEELCADLEQQSPRKPVAPEYFAKLVYRAADYGQSNGFPPHHDFRHVQRLLAGIDVSQCADEFTFGQDGKPLFIPGPSDSFHKMQVLAARVQRAGGNYFLPIGSGEQAADMSRYLADEADDVVEADNVVDAVNVVDADERELE